LDREAAEAKLQAVIAQAELQARLAREEQEAVARVNQERLAREEEERREKEFQAEFRAQREVAERARREQAAYRDNQKLLAQAVAESYQQQSIFSEANTRKELETAKPFSNSSNIPPTQKDYLSPNSSSLDKKQPLSERFRQNVQREKENDPFFNRKPSFFQQLKYLEGLPTLIVVSVMAILLIFFMFFILPALIRQPASSQRQVTPTATPTATAVTSTPGISLVDEIAAQPCRVGQIKGSQSKIYHLPGQDFYAETKNNVTCFNSEAEAQSAGFRKSKT
jgi:hypothetical protein